MQAAPLLCVPQLNQSYLGHLLAADWDIMSVCVVYGSDVLPWSTVTRAVSSFVVALCKILFGAPSLSNYEGEIPTTARVPLSLAFTWHSSQKKEKYENTEVHSE